MTLTVEKEWNECVSAAALSEDVVFIVNTAGALILDDGHSAERSLTAGSFRSVRAGIHRVYALSEDRRLCSFDEGGILTWERTIDASAVGRFFVSPNSGGDHIDVIVRQNGPLRVLRFDEAGNQLDLRTLEGKRAVIRDDIAWTRGPNGITAIGLSDYSIARFGMNGSGRMACVGSMCAAMDGTDLVLLSAKGSQELVRAPIGYEGGRPVLFIEGDAHFAAVGSSDGTCAFLNVSGETWTMHSSLLFGAAPVGLADARGVLFVGAKGLARFEKNRCQREFSFETELRPERAFLCGSKLFVGVRHEIHGFALRRFAFRQENVAD